MRWAEQYMTMPFVDGGRDKSGCDCWGLVYLALKEQKGIIIPEYNQTSTRAVIRIRRLMTEHSATAPWQKVVDYKADEQEAFDVVIMAARAPGSNTLIPVHVGLMVNKAQVLHIQHSTGVVIEDLREHTVYSRIISIHRHEALL